MTKGITVEQIEKALGEVGEDLGTIAHLQLACQVCGKFYRPEDYSSVKEGSHTPIVCPSCVTPEEGED